MAEGEENLPPIPTAEETRENLEEETEETLEEIGQQLLERLDAIDARLDDFETRLSGYSAIDHKHEQPNTSATGSEPDEHPRPDRFWFRKLGE